MEKQNNSTEQLSQLESEIVEELFFATTYSDLSQEFNDWGTAYKLAVEKLLDTGFIKMTNSFFEADEEEKSRLEENTFVATKKGLLSLLGKV